MSIPQGEHTRKIRLHQIDTPGDNSSLHEIDIGAGNSTFEVIKSARMRGLEVRRVATGICGGIQWCARGRRIAVKRKGVKI